MAFTYNGFGTKYYGEANLRPDGSFITTEWITAAYVPLIPIQSFRLVRVRAEDVNVVVFQSKGYGVLEKLSIYWPQVGRIYAFVVGAAGWWIGMGWLFFVKWAILDRPNAAIFLFASIVGMAFPFVVVWWFRREAFRAQHGELQPPRSS